MLCVRPAIPAIPGVYYVRITAENNNGESTNYPYPDGGRVVGERQGASPALPLGRWQGESRQRRQLAALHCWA